MACNEERSQTRVNEYGPWDFELVVRTRFADRESMVRFGLLCGGILRCTRRREAVHFPETVKAPSFDFNLIDDQVRLSISRATTNCRVTLCGLLSFVLCARSPWACTSRSAGAAWPRKFPLRREVWIVIRPCFLIIRRFTGCSRTPYKVNV